MINYYEVLGIKQEATPEEIKRAYRRMLRITHPDTSTNNTEHLAALVNDAYKTLSGGISKIDYDKKLRKHLQETEAEEYGTPPPSASTPPESETPKAEPQTPDPDDYIYNAGKSPNQEHDIFLDEEDMNFSEGNVEGNSSVYSSEGTSTDSGVSQPKEEGVLSTIQYIFSSFIRVIRWSIKLEGKRAQKIWIAVLTLGVLGLILWGGLIGFVLSNPDTSIAWVGSTLSFILWLCGWLFIGYRSSIAAVKLADSISDSNAKIASSKKQAHKVYLKTRQFFNKITSGAWVLLQATILMLLSFLITHNIWSKAQVDSRVFIISIGVLIASWIAVVSASFFYGLKIRKQL